MEIELQADSDEQDKWSKKLATRLKAGFAGLPKLARGCYEKQGYSLEIIPQGDVYAYKASGATRMLYASLRNPNVVAKVMPAKSSKLWQPGWTQNVTEAASLRKLESFNLAPRVHHHHHLELRFVNRWGETDTMDVLVLDRLGHDLKKAAEIISFPDYVEAFVSALWAIAKMAKFDYVVPDPHPYNVSLVFGSTTLALPCDYGEITVARLLHQIRTRTRKAL